jgi:hypothetical protein
MRKFVFGGSYASAVPLLLDTYPAAAAYSLRKLRTAYTGAAIRVRRSSDNAEQDIGFVGVDLDAASLLSFVGANDGRVVTWYDQSLNGIDKGQPLAANQPYIVDSGALLVENTKPAVYRTKPSLNTTTWMYAPHTFPTGDVLTTNVFVGKRINVSGYNAIVGVAPLNGSATTRDHINKSIEGTLIFAVRLEGGNTIFATTGVGGYAQSLFSSWRDTPNTDFKTRHNGVDLVVSSSGASKDLNITSTSAFTLFHTGSVNYNVAPSSPVNGIVQESIWWLNDESANLPNIETNINTYYGIY